MFSIVFAKPSLQQYIIFLFVLPLLLLMLDSIASWEAPPSKNLIAAFCPKIVFRLFFLLFSPPRLRIAREPYMKTSGTNMIQSDSDRIEWCQTFVDATFLHTSLDSLRYFVLCFPLLGRPLAWCVALLAPRCIVLRCQIVPLIFGSL